MVLRFTIFGLLLVLIAVIALSHYSNKEGFQALDQKAPVKPTGPVPPPAVKPVAPTAAPVAKPTPLPATGSDLSKGSSLVPTAGTSSGPAPFPPTTSPVTSMVHSAGAASAPQFNHVTPQIGVSPTGAVAGDAQQKTDFLSSIQKIIRNELLAARSTDTGVKSHNGSVPSTDSHSLTQGKEFSKGKKTSDCPDMEDYIKKDSIPCWGCALDY